MSKCLEDVFKSEFKQAISNVGYKDIFKIPLPEECSKWSISNTEIYAIKGITVDYFKDLNKTSVMKPYKNTLIKRRVIDKATRGFKKDNEGNFIYEDFPIPMGSMAVVSRVNINLPYDLYRKKIDKEGYGYVDCTNDGKFIYVLPKSVLYKVNQTALVLSVKNMKNYSGCGYMTWNNGSIFLHIIPYNPNSKYIGSKVLKTGIGLSYNNEISTILKFLQERGIIPNLSLCKMYDGSNLATKTTFVGYDFNEYVPVDNLAIGDREIYGSDSSYNGVEC